MNYAFFLSLFQLGAIAVPNKSVLGTLNIHDDSKSKNKLRLIRWQWLSYKMVGINWFKRWYYLFCGGYTD